MKARIEYHSIEFRKSRSKGKRFHIMDPNRRLDGWSVCGVHCPNVLDSTVVVNPLMICHNCMNMTVITYTERKTES